MGSLTNHQIHDVAIIMVPFPAQGHLNQLLQLSCLISSYKIPIYYVGSAIHNRQAKSRVNGLDPTEVAKIHFHDLPITSFASPPPNPHLSDKFPTQLTPAWDAALSLRQPFATYLQELSMKAKRLVVIHDPMMATVVQDVSSVPTAESYAFNVVSAFCLACFKWEIIGKPYPDELPRELPPFLEVLSDEMKTFMSSQIEHLNCRAGDIHNSCRLIEAPYLDLFAKDEVKGNMKNWAIGPILPTKLSYNQNRCLDWLDKQKPRSVIYVSFGTTTSLSNEQIEELALGLEQSKQKFLWVLRDADKGDIFDGEVTRPKLPEGFEERIQGVGMVFREWAPQPEILAHPSTGGFMSHCGWNSCMESLTMGVPIAAWPMHSDQPANSILITQKFKTGLEVREGSQKEELVKALTIEKAVKRLMESEEGNEVRKRAEELAATLRQATEKGGVSQLELDSFIAHITRDFIAETK